MSTTHKSMLIIADMVFQNGLNSPKVRLEVDSYAWVSMKEPGNLTGSASNKESKSGQVAW